jgi:hypothetical protein
MLHLGARLGLRSLAAIWLHRLALGAVLQLCEPNRYYGSSPSYV